MCVCVCARAQLHIYVCTLYKFKLLGVYCEMGLMLGGGAVPVMYVRMFLYRHGAALDCAALLAVLHTIGCAFVYTIKEQHLLYGLAPNMYYAYNTAILRLALIPCINATPRSHTQSHTHTHTHTQSRPLGPATAATTRPASWACHPLRPQAKQLACVWLAHTQAHL